MEGDIVVWLFALGGHKAYDYGGHPAPTGPALPNLINAVGILKSKSKPPMPP